MNRLTVPAFRPTLAIRLRDAMRRLGAAADVPCWTEYLRQTRG